MKNKYYYYVVVRSNNEARLVTKICEDTRYAHWDKDAAPISFAKTYAQDLAYCLNLNFYPAYVLQSYHKIDSQIFCKKEENADEC